MSTHALIGKLLPDGRVKYIYLHYDGYFSHAGFVLRNFYRGEKRVDDLLALGNLSCLGPSPYGKSTSTAETTDAVHCRAYIRDCGRKEKEERATTIGSKELFFAQNDKTYLYESGRWYHVYCGMPTDITPLWVTHCEESYCPFTDLVNVGVYAVDSSSRLQKIPDPPRRWAELRERATREGRRFYVFHEKNNRLIRTVFPATGQHEGTVVNMNTQKTDAHE